MMLCKGRNDFKQTSNGGTAQSLNIDKTAVTVAARTVRPRFKNLSFKSFFTVLSYVESREPLIRVINIMAAKKASRIDPAIANTSNGDLR